jgi:intergrase/recombinase
LKPRAGFEPATYGLRKENLAVSPLPLETVDWDSFRAYLLNKHRKRWALEIHRLAKQHYGLVDNLAMLDSFSRSKKAKVLQSLIALSKYCGCYEQFKAKVKSYGIKWRKPSSLDAFLRIRNSQNSKVLEWLRQASQVLGEDSTILEFALVSGLRTSEAIESFNLVIKLSRENKLEEYFNTNASVLEHFAFPETFLRQTKNAFISLLPRDLIKKVCQCKPLTYSSIKKKLQRKGLPMQFDKLRDYFGSYMVQHGCLIREEVDLLQGRIGESIFTRHYFSPSFIELKDRTLKAVEGLRQQA